MTLINLLFTGFEIVFRMFNELFFLLCILFFEKFFFNVEIGKLKEMTGFIVDNGSLEVLSNLFV